MPVKKRENEKRVKSVILSHNLYEINESLQKILDEASEYASENEGEYPENIEEHINILEIARDEKIRNFGRFIKSKKAWKSSIEIEIQTLKKKLSAADKDIEFAKNFLSSVLDKESKEKYKDATCSIYWMDTQSVEVTKEPEEIPDLYCKIERVAKLTDIKAALKSGRKLDFAGLKNNRSLVLR